MRKVTRTVGVGLALAVLTATHTAPAMAGERSAGVWEGVAIGLGAGLLLNAISHPAVVYYQPVPPPVVYYEPAPPPVIYAYPAEPAVIVPRLRYHSIYGPPYGTAHGYWKHGRKGHHGHDDD